MSLAACGRVEAASVGADLAVSATVLDQCLIHSASRSASCTGGAAYALNVGREKVAVATTDQLTTADEHAHTFADGQGGARSGMLADAVERDAELAPEALRTVSRVDTSTESIRVTYSF